MARNSPAAATTRRRPPRLFGRSAKEAREARELSPAAVHSHDCRGRKFPEEEDDLRTCYERDRDRIVHTTAFRRLMYKAQVFVNWEGDHYRTRLSHTLEVCQVARSISSALALNEPFTEALALAHDIGHPPFGHRGEWALDRLMQAHGGFRHNAQVLRVVDILERRSPDYPGLNLTREVRESLLKHEKKEDWPAELEPRSRRPYAEAQVVDLADSTAYNVHDLEDGLTSEIFSERELEQECALWVGAREAVEHRHPGFLKSSHDRKLRIKRIANEVLKICINDLIETSARQLEAARWPSADALRASARPAVAHSAALRTEVTQLQRFLFRHFYRHPHLAALERMARDTLEILFRAYCAAPARMSVWYQTWAEQVGLERAVCDYVAGMTDRYAETEARELGRAAKRRTVRQARPSKP
jgi:dGTPase